MSNRDVSLRKIGHEVFALGAILAATGLIPPPEIPVLNANVDARESGL